MATHTVTKTVDAPGGQATAAMTYTATGSVEITDEAIAGTVTDFQINVAIDFSALKSLWIHCDQAITIETNSGSAPDDTLTPAAGVPIEWQHDSEHACPLSADVTALFVTNASGVAATFNLRALQDATP